MEGLVIVKKSDLEKLQKQIASQGASLQALNAAIATLVGGAAKAKQQRKPRVQGGGAAVLPTPETTEVEETKAEKAPKAEKKGGSVVQMPKAKIVANKTVAGKKSGGFAPAAMPGR